MNRILGLVSILSLFLAASLTAQSTTSLRGTVTDLTGAVIPGASLTITNVATQATRSSTTDESGAYTFPQIIPGLYQLKASAAGFNDVVVDDLRLLVNQPVTQNVRFEKIGTVAETVSVSAEATQLNTSDASLGNAVGTKPIIELPFNARNVVGLLALQPGVVFLGDDRDQTSSDFRDDSRSGSVNGSRNDQSNITLDGVDVNDQIDRSPFDTVLRVTLDSVQEFRTTTLNATADQGRTSGAQVALVTKSGTNDYHGSTYWFHRNTVTAANSFFNNAIPASDENPSGGIERPKLIRNIFGASVGGPIVKNRAFFFANYEGRRDAREDSVNRVVPTAELRQGIARYFDNGGNIQSVSPSQMAAVIDPLGIGPSVNSLQVLQSYPLPNNNDVGDTLNRAGFRFNAPIGLRWNTYIAKLDFVLDRESRHNAFVRANLQNDNANELPQFPGLPPNRVNLNNSKGLAVGLTSLVSPTVINDFRYGFTRQGFENTGVGRFPQVNFRNFDDPVGNTYGFRALIPVHTISDTLTFTKGSHTVKSGFIFRGVQNDRLTDQNSWSFAQTNASWLAGQGETIDAPFTDMDPGFQQDFRDAVMAAMGVVPDVTAVYNFLVDGTQLPEGAPVQRVFQNNEYEFFVSDEWRLKPNLTITAGLRWSLMPPVKEKNGQQLSASIPLGDWLHRRAILAENGISQQEAGTISYLPLDDPNAQGLYPFHKKNFAPRLGIAWSPGFESGLGKFLFGGAGKTSIRAGFGMFYDVFGQGILRRFDASSFGLSTSLNSVSGTQTLATAPRYQGFNAVPESLKRPAPPASFPATFPNSFEITNAVDQTVKPPYSFTANFNIGREFRGGWFMQFGYVGRFGRRLLVQEDAATPTNFRDPVSKQTYFEAATALANLANAGADPADVAPIPFWENVWANFNNSAFVDFFGDPSYSVTQNMYSTLVNGFDPRDITFMLFTLDDGPNGGCEDFGTCSVYGPNLMFNPQYSALAVWRSVGKSSYNAFQYNLRKTFSNGDLIDFNYTLSKSIDLGSSAERVSNFQGIISNPWFRNQFRAVSDFDTRHLVTAAVVYNLPFGSGKRFMTNSGGLLNSLFGGWQLSAVYRQTSGFPREVLNGRFWPTNWNDSSWATATGTPPQGGVTKNATGLDGTVGPNIFSNPKAAIDAFSHALPGQVGTRNSIRGDGVFQIDTNLAKSFVMPWNEGHRLQFRWEAFNVTNTPTFDVFQSTASLGSRSAFGKYNGLLGTPRVMQFGLRYDF